MNYILAKKIYYRSEKGNDRDLFDIALAIHKEPDILKKLKLNFSKIKTLYETINIIKSNDELLKQYKNDITQMNPAKEYSILAFNTINYLSEFLDNFISAYNMGVELDSNEFKNIEEFVYNTSIKEDK